MRFNLIIHRYIFRELVTPFVTSLLFLTFIFLMTKILDITHLIVNYRIGVFTVVRMLIYAMPFFLEFVIPMAVLLAVLLTFMRLSADNEIVALKSGGVGLYKLLPPVLLFSFLAALLTAVIAIEGLPRGRMAIRELVREVALSHFDIGIKARTFTDTFKDVVLYVNHIDSRTRTLKDVFIEDRRSTETTSVVVAPLGQLLAEPENLVLNLRLFDGSISRVDLDTRAAHTIEFDSYDIRLELGRALNRGAGGPKDEEEMSLAELREYIRSAQVRDDQYYLTLMEFHKKFSLPSACLAMGLLALPLGIGARTSKKSMGVGLGLVCFLMYYLLLSAGWVFGESGSYPPLIGMWVPNAVMGGLGIFLLIRNANERTGLRDLWPWSSKGAGNQ